MKWLITGGCGFIGRALITNLLADDANSIRVLDNLSVGQRDDLRAVSEFAELPLAESASPWNDRVALMVGDICDADAALAAVTGADVVVHLAANTGVAPSVENPRADCQTNVLGTLNMLEACRAAKVARFIFASSGAPLGVQVPPLHEGLAPHPASPYGASKLAGEGYCSAYFHCFGVETVALRFGNVYGEGSGHKQSVVAKFIKMAMAGETLELYGDGTQTRDFIHISDLINAVQRAATVPGIGGEVFQIATALETTVQEMTDELLAALEEEGIPRPPTRFGDRRDGDVMRNFSDTTKAREQLNWQTSVPLKEGLKQTIRYFKDRS